MVHNDAICPVQVSPIIVTFDTVQQVLINSAKVCQNWLRMVYDDNERQAVHNTASTDLV